MTPQLEQVLTVNIRQANRAQAVINTINGLSDLSDAEKAEKLVEMSKAVTQRDGNVRVIKRNLSKVGNNTIQDIKRVLNPDVYEMLLG